MKNSKNILGQFLFCTAALLTSNILTTSPIQAATFASSTGRLVTDNYSQSPQSTNTNTNSNTNALVESATSSVFALAEANSLFKVDSPFAANYSFSSTAGKGGGYLGLAQSQAEIIGNFLVEAKTSFSFDFQGLLSLETSIDDLNTEKAKAFGELSLLLIDNTDLDELKLIDYLIIYAQITTPKDRDVLLSPQFSQNISLDLWSSQTFWGGTQEFTESFFQGSFSSYFDRHTSLSLVKVQNNQVKVTNIPEPSLILGLGLVLVSMRKLR